MEINGVNGPFLQKKTGKAILWGFLIHNYPFQQIFPVYKKWDSRQDYFDSFNLRTASLNFGITSKASPTIP